MGGPLEGVKVASCSTDMEAEGEREWAGRSRA